MRKYITTDNSTLSVEQEEILDKDIEASCNPKNLVNHEIALQKMSKWLKK